MLRSLITVEADATCVSDSSDASEVAGSKTEMSILCGWLQTQYVQKFLFVKLLLDKIA